MKKTFISFDLNSINVSGKKEDNFEPIKIQPNEAGSDPNINSVIKLMLKIQMKYLINSKMKIFN